MKPEWIEEMADETAEAYHKWLHGTRLKHSTPELSRFIARALIAAEQRGMEKAAEIAEKCAHHPAGPRQKADILQAIRQASKEIKP